MKRTYIVNANSISEAKEKAVRRFTRDSANANNIKKGIYVIYKENGRYKGTDFKNFKSNCRDSAKVDLYKDFNTLIEVKMKAKRLYPNLRIVDSVKRNTPTIHCTKATKPNFKSNITSTTLKSHRKPLNTDSKNGSMKIVPSNKVNRL